MPSDYYALLGISYDATPEEIRSAYFHLARNVHPDVNPDAAANEAFIEIQRAYEILSNPHKKADYDKSLPPEARLGAEISVNARYSLTVIPNGQEAQLLYALVELICTGDSPDGRAAPAHVCLVLDRSTSMHGPRLDMVKSSALNLIQQLRGQDLLSIVAFSDRAEVLIPPTRASALSKSDHRISLLQSSGSTEILQGLRAGVEQLRETQTIFSRHLVLLTDGHTYGDEIGCLNLAREVADEGITISVLGIGNEWQDDLMDQIAGLSGGNARLITGPRDLENFLMGKLGEMETVYARGLKFQFESTPDVRLRYAFRLNPNIGPLENVSPILLGDIHYRRSVTFLLEFLIPPLAEDVDFIALARGQIEMEIPGRAARARLMLDLNRPADCKPEIESPPAVIVEAMSKLTLYRLQEKVRQEVSAGQIDKATRHLHYLATHLLAQGDRELAHTVLLEAEHVQQSRRFSTEGEKRIKYGTRALMLPSGPELQR